MALEIGLQEVKQEIFTTLSQKIIPFWLKRAVDGVYGGYLTSFDKNGNPDTDESKYLTTQSRMLWGFSRLLPYASEEDRPKMAAAARQGYSFLMDHFWDKEQGGFFWKLTRDAKVLEPAKLIYGQSFALYALSEFAIAFQHQDALDVATETFSLLQTFAADTCYGGYYENLERDWRPSPCGDFAGDRKSLDIHMHLMEAFTRLYEASQQEVHKRKLLEVIQLILHHMVDKQHSYGCNQFTLDFQRIPAIGIKRTWNAERESGESLTDPLDTTSYGHNVELSWLLDRAGRALGTHSDSQLSVMEGLLSHALLYGYDYQHGGVYRDGLDNQPATVTDKEWWQNFEAMVGFYNGYLRFGREDCKQAFLGTWAFNKRYFMNMEVGESRQLLKADGTPLVENLGNPWKGIYHTGRALAECVDMISSVIL